MAEHLLGLPIKHKFRDIKNRDHALLTNVLSDQHHSKLHEASHRDGGADAIAGALALAAIPNLPASRITSGILAAARGGLAKALSPTWTDNYILVYKVATDEFVMEAKPAGDGGGADEKVKVSSLDTTTNYLIEKLLAGEGITLTKKNPGGDEDLEIATLNTLLLDGSRAMTGKLQAKDAKFTLPNTSLEIQEKEMFGYYYPRLLPTDSTGSNVLLLGSGIYCYDPIGNSPALVLYGFTAGEPDPTDYGMILYNVANYGGLYFATGAGSIIFNPYTGHVKLDEIRERQTNVGVMIEYVKLKDGHIEVDKIIERTLNAGVNIETVLLKDGLVDGIDVAVQATKVRSKVVDESAIGDDKILVYKSASDTLKYESKPAGAGLQHERGRFEVLNAPKNYSTYPISFPSSFSAVPRVNVSIEVPDAESGEATCGIVQGTITQNGFTAFIVNNTGGVCNFHIQWMAVEQ